MCFLKCTEIAEHLDHGGPNGGRLVPVTEELIPTSVYGFRIDAHPQTDLKTVRLLKTLQEVVKEGLVEKEPARGDQEEHRQRLGTCVHSSPLFAFS